MKRITGIIIVTTLLMSACNSKRSNIAKEKESYENAKETLEEKEKKNPLSFLLVNSRDKHNLIGQTVIQGNVTNIAKVCSYKDVQLELSFYSKTGTLLEKGNETVYDEIAPGKSASFKIKNFAPKGSDSVAIKVLGAKTK
ncbi:MAG: FxLYD domain-containing protein [Ferruginibacter sp.]